MSCMDVARCGQVKYTAGSLNWELNEIMPSIAYAVSEE